MCKSYLFLEEFSTFLNYVKRLEFEEKPDYHYMRNLFITLLLRSGSPYDQIFDWMLPKAKRREQQRAAIVISSSTTPKHKLDNSGKHSQLKQS